LQGFGGLLEKAHFNAEFAKLFFLFAYFRHVLFPGNYFLQNRILNLVKRDLFNIQDFDVMPFDAVFAADFRIDLLNRMLRSSNHHFFCKRRLQVWLADLTGYSENLHLIHLPAQHPVHSQL
jgi:hypothetical protein